jgi:hypothetical protein
MIGKEVRRFDAITPPGNGAPHGIFWPQAGQDSRCRLHLF